MHRETGTAMAHKLLLLVEGRPPVATPSAQQIADALMEITISGPSFVRLEREDGCYVQVAGARAKVTVELRTAAGAHYVIGKSETVDERHHVNFTGGSLIVSRSEMFAARVAVEFIEAFVGTGDLPGELTRRDITKFGAPFEKLGLWDLQHRANALEFASTLDPDAPLDATLLTVIVEESGLGAPPRRYDRVYAGEHAVAELVGTSLPAEHFHGSQSVASERQKGAVTFRERRTQLDGHTLREALLSVERIDILEAHTEVFEALCRKGAPEVLEWEARNVRKDDLYQREYLAPGSLSPEPPRGLGRYLSSWFRSKG